MREREGEEEEEVLRRVNVLLEVVGGWFGQASREEMGVEGEGEGWRNDGQVGEEGKEEVEEEGDGDEASEGETDAIGDEEEDVGIIPNGGGEEVEEEKGCDVGPQDEGKKSENAEASGCLQADVQSSMDADKHLVPAELDGARKLEGKGDDEEEGEGRAEVG